MPLLTPFRQPDAIFLHTPVLHALKVPEWFPSLIDNLGDEEIVNIASMAFHVHFYPACVDFLPNAGTRPEYYRSIQHSRALLGARICEQVDIDRSMVSILRHYQKHAKTLLGGIYQLFNTALARCWQQHRIAPMCASYPTPIRRRAIHRKKSVLGSVHVLYCVLG